MSCILYTKLYMYVALRCLATNSVSASAFVCLTLVLGTAITFALRLWHGCSGIALRAQPQSRSELRVRVLAATASSRNSSLSNGSAQRWLLNVINLASLRFHVSSLSQRNCFRSCQLQSVASCQLPVASCQLQQPLYSQGRLFGLSSWPLSWP